MTYYHLEDREARTIIKVVRKTKMDCWFFLDKKPDGYFVYDLEKRKAISLRTALKIAKDGFIELESLGISKEEIDIINRIFEKLKIH